MQEEANRQTRSMSRNAAQERARVTWSSACERLAKALHPAPGAAGEPNPDLTEALLVAQLSLDAVRAAFEAEARQEQPKAESQQTRGR